MLATRDEVFILALGHPWCWIRVLGLTRPGLQVSHSMGISAFTHGAPLHVDAYPYDDRFEDLHAVAHLVLLDASICWWHSFGVAFHPWLPRCPRLQWWAPSLGW